MAETDTYTKSEHYNRGITLYDHGMYSEAITEFEHVLESANDVKAPEWKLASFYLCESYTNLGLAHLHMNMCAKAETELKFALTLHPEYADLHFHLAMTYYRDGDYKKSEKQFQEAVRINPRYSRALMYRGLSQLRQGKSEGLVSIETASTVQPAYIDGRYRQAVLMYESGNTEQAVHIFQQIADIDIEQIGFIMAEALKLMKEEKFHDAAGVLEEAVSLCPNYADIRHYLGMCYLRQGLTNQAMNQFISALKINPGFVAARMNLAEVHRQEGRIGLAIDELGSLLHIEPDNLAAQKMLNKLRDTK